MTNPRTLVQVESSTGMTSIGYDPETSELFVNFKNGRYTYRDVPQTVFDEFLAAPSKGKYFVATVRNRYQFSKEAPPDGSTSDEPHS